MSTRFNNKNNSRFNVPGLSSGYDSISAPVNLTVPACGIEDADEALFNLFDKEIMFQVSTSDKNREELKRVPVIFAAAEKWALAKRYKAIRDRTGSLILPLITVVRTTIQQTSNDDITGRGINQQTGEITVQRRLDKSDRGYQGLINRLLIKHQTNLSSSPSIADADQLSSDRSLGQLTDDPTVNDGGYMLPDRQNNIYETLVLPSPQFFTAVYEVTFWTQYTVQMFQLVETLIGSFLPQGNAWRLETPKGYWYVATVDGNVYNAENNVDDMSQEERLIKYKFTVKVPAYIIATKVPGAPVPIKRYVSSPTISFDVGVGTTEEQSVNSVIDPFLGADDPTLPMNEINNHRRDQRMTNSTRLYPGSTDVSTEDPALNAFPRGISPVKYKKVTSINANGKTVTQYIRIVSVNRFSGETVYASGADLGGLTIEISDE